MKNSAIQNMITEIRIQITAEMVILKKTCIPAMGIWKLTCPETVKASLNLRLLRNIKIQ